MPRLPTSLLRHARAINPLLPLLLQTCRTIPSALNESRRLREHVNERLEKKFGSAKDVPERLRHRCVRKLVRKRARGEPLQYLLGSQPFKDLDIKCGRGVLIPRQCTEAYTEALARLITNEIRQLSQPPPRVRIVDFCTGTGCISLLLLSLLSESLPNVRLDISGIDISPTALALAKKNYKHNIPHFGNTSKHSATFEHADLLNPVAEISEDDVWCYGESDDVFTIVVFNPPYILESVYDQQTGRSVRNYQPKLAHVVTSIHSGITHNMDPNFPEDIFYTLIADRAVALGARIMLLEVPGTEQAVRVAKMVLERHEGEFEGGLWEKCEVWGDEPDATNGEVEDIRSEEGRDMESMGIGLRGAGMGRSVLFRRHELPVEVEGHGCYVRLR